VEPPLGRPDGDEGPRRGQRERVDVVRERSRQALVALALAAAGEGRLGVTERAPADGRVPGPVEALASSQSSATATARQ
jgi:hypothetical protein